MQSGHAFLRSFLGVPEERLPKIGWQIDPFGPSAWTPALMTRMGEEGGRVGGRVGGREGGREERESTELLNDEKSYDHLCLPP